jgi:hypothetical protein
MRAGATVILNFDGTSAKGEAVSFQADLTISGDNLQIVLRNNSTQSLNPDDLLTSFYFDIQDGLGNRPTLSYASASGDVYLADQASADTLQTAGADLQALVSGDNTWQFRDIFTLQPGTEVLAFGIGTAGNNSLTPNNFQGNVVDGIDYGIYAGDITTQNLDGILLVRGPATFNFTGVSGFTEDDISREALFGLGTQPDSTGFVPEPGSFAMLALGLMGLGLHGRRRRDHTR